MHAGFADTSNLGFCYFPGVTRVRVSAQCDNIGSKGPIGGLKYTRIVSSPSDPGVSNKELRIGYMPESTSLC